MKDQELRKMLDETHENQTFESLLNHKIDDKGLSEEEAYKDIIATSTKTNEEFDRKAGVNRETLPSEGNG